MKALHVTGCYYFPNSSQHQYCTAQVNNEQVQLLNQNNDLIHSASTIDCILESPIPGVAAQLSFCNGGRFIPDDVDFRWPFGNKVYSISERLEKNKLLILLSVVVAPLLLWLILYRGIPAIAVYSVNVASPAVVESMGEQSLAVIEKIALEPTQLSIDQQADLQSKWAQMLTALELDNTKFRLSFYQSDYLAANAFALPHGRVVVTDELVTLLADKPDALRAILLHEIGHVEHHHGVRLSAQAVASTVVLAVIFGDLEGITEVVLGSGSSFLQQAFSRDMEREADNYAIEKLVKLGYSNHDFADAIEALQQSLEEQHAELEDNWLKYLSTHPSSQERIEHARQYKP
ncbi:peptidase [Pseudoalteromonas porphyrae]|uniref:Peptidase n=1 Tax=Pseudoalteromonas porphyrae TaxID=187330 RepID=A0A0N1EPD6_9GAMM|nr:MULTISPECIES: M48 family metallopeptidase [Pseudoalteromonas]KPH60163.1 peptidase [Pseudoalteromonas porphyrae]KPH93226.1 peptidase [Pseudoalteromonas porphyrae]